MFGQSNDKGDTIEIMEAEFSEMKTYIWAIPSSWSRDEAQEFVESINTTEPPFYGHHVAIPADGISSGNFDVTELDPEEVQHLKEQLEER